MGTTEELLKAYAEEIGTPSTLTVQMLISSHRLLRQKALATNEELAASRAKAIKAGFEHGKSQATEGLISREKLQAMTIADLAAFVAGE